jgi:hypothetical protein
MRNELSGKDFAHIPAINMIATEYLNRKGLTGFPGYITSLCTDACLWQYPSVGEHALVGRNLACYEFLKIAA